MTTKYKMEWPYLLYVRQAVFEFIASSALEPSPENPGVPFLYYTAENKVLSYPNRPSHPSFQILHRRLQIGLGVLKTGGLDDFFG